MIPDVRSLTIDQARQKIYAFDKNLNIVIKETINRKDLRYFNYSIKDTIVIAQRVIDDEVELIVAYTTLQL
ncbi:MAG: hypothetical protein JW702_10375 [Clostridiales bacterium]|nr:hypothetical protein [Clostridiales bacterium]